MLQPVSVTFFEEIIGHGRQHRSVESGPTSIEEILVVVARLQVVKPNEVGAHCVYDR